MKKYLAILCTLLLLGYAFVPGPLPVHAAIALVNTASGGDVTGTAVGSIATGAFSATGGNLIVCGERHDTTADDPSSVTDTAGNTYTKIASADLGASDRLTVWYAKNITGNASNVVTATYAANRAYVEIICHQYSGLDTTAPLDTSATGTVVSPSSAASVTTGAFSTAQNDEVSVCFASVDSLGRDFNAGTGYTKQVDLSTMASQDQIFSTTQSSVTASMSDSLSSSLHWEMVCAVFKMQSTSSTPAGPFQRRNP